MTLRKTLALLAVGGLALSSGGHLEAAICGFPGIVTTGAAGGGTAFVILFSPVAPFAFTGIGSVPLAGPFGTTCADIWISSTLGPPPPNFNAVWAAAPPACAAAGCVGPAVCTPATLCMAFP